MNDLSGQRVGRLSITDTSRPGTKAAPGRTWLCVCDCGSETWVSASLLRRRRHPTRSCGCLARDNGKAYLRNYGAVAPLRLPEGDAARRMRWNEYRRSAFHKGLDWAIPYELFEMLSKHVCAYCGSPPAGRFRGKVAFNGPCVYNGLDRQDNRLGYTPDNVVPCCATCNMAKRALTVEEFLAHARRICEHQEALRAARA